MNRGFANKPVIVGVALVVLYTLISAISDAAAKFISLDFAAPQLFALSGALVALFSFIGAARKGNLQELRTKQPWAMFHRSVMTVASACLFFYAFRELPLAEVFIFVGMMPIMAALLTPFILKEQVPRSAWLILLCGFLGVVCLFPEGIASISTGHLVALLASLTGVISMVIARLVGKRENKPFALVFYPHLFMFLVMGAALPFVFQPMTMTELAIAGLYSLSLFIGRFVLVRALSLAPTHVVMPVMNLQFLWVVGLGATVFAERPTPNIWLGTTIVIASCVALVRLGSSESSVLSNEPLARFGPLRVPYPRLRSLYRSRMNLSRSGSRQRNERR